MKRISRVIGVLVVLLSGIVCNGACGPASSDVCDSQGCMNLDTFSTQLTNALNGQLAPNGDPGNVAGYIFYIGSRPPVFNGPARTSADPPATRMGPNIPGQIASLSKTLTAIGVIKSLARNSLTIHSPIKPYLPPDWHVGDNVQYLVFRDLLTHTSGFGGCVDSTGTDSTYQGLQQMIAAGVPVPSLFGTPPHPANYNNCNFALFRVLLPNMEHYTIPSGEAPDVAYAGNYIDYMQKNVFQPVGITGAECAAGEAPPFPPAIQSYPVPPGSSHGNDWGDLTLRCGAGGWVIKPQDLETVVTDLASGNTLLTPDQKTGPDGMFTNSLGWDGTAVRGDCAGWIPPRAPWSPYNCKNGGYGADNPSGPTLSTYLGIFKCIVPVVVYVNSDMSLPSIAVGGFFKFDDIIDVVGAAYKNSITTNTGPPGARHCPV